MKTNQQLAEEIRIRDLIDAEREKSDNLYAKILVERIVFGVISSGGLILLGYVISFFFKN
jgi:hypothetical protein